jgi:hypothetical protein
VSASPQLQLGGLGPAAQQAALPDLEEVDQGLYDWLLMMGPDSTQAAALQLPESRSLEQQHHHQQLVQQYQRALPFSMHQNASGDGCGPLPQAAAAAAGPLAPSDGLQRSASNPGPAVGAYGLVTSSKPAMQSRPRSYSMNP